MEGIVAIILAIVGIAIFRMILSAGFRTVGAAAKAAVGHGSFSDNMELAFKGMGALEARFADARFGENEDGPHYLAIEVKGLFPVDMPRSVGFITSVFDNTDENPAPVLAAIEAFQESDTVVYQHVSDVGRVSPDQGYINWVRVGAVVPELLQPPYSGERKLLAVLRLVDMNNKPAIQQGFHDPDDTGVLWASTLEFDHSASEQGYLEVAKSRDQARALSIQIGMAVAMADGSLDDDEGTVLKDWIVRAISPFSEEKQEELKEIYNSAMSRAYDAARTGDLSLSALTEELNGIAETSIRYETIELCFDVMAADGVADAEEMKIIRKVADVLELDFDEIEKMRDQKIIGLDTSVSNQASVEEMIGIDENWDADQIKKHLLMEFQKWNNRLNTLEEGEERDNAQRMLDTIAEARKKYA